jgi:hypothetical protein
MTLASRCRSRSSCSRHKRRVPAEPLYVANGRLLAGSVRSEQDTNALSRARTVLAGVTNGAIKRGEFSVVSPGRSMSTTGSISSWRPYPAGSVATAPWPGAALKLIGAAKRWLLQWAMSADAATDLHTLQERSRGAVYAEPLWVTKGCRRQHG